MNFDLAIDRTCTDCQKWDNVPHHLRRAGCASDVGG